jgi:hypothetical protein
MVLVIVLAFSFVAIVLIPGLELASELADTSVALKFAGQQQRNPALIRAAAETDFSTSGRVPTATILSPRTPTALANGATGSAVKTFALKKTRSLVVSWARTCRTEWHRDKATRTKEQGTTVRKDIYRDVASRRETDSNENTCWLIYSFLTLSKEIFGPPKSLR